MRPSGDIQEKTGKAPHAAHAAERELLLLDDGAPTAPRAKPGRARSAGAADGALRATRRTRARNSRQRRGHGSVNDAASTLDASFFATLPRSVVTLDFRSSPRLARVFSRPDLVVPPDLGILSRVCY